MALVFSVRPLRKNCIRLAYINGAAKAITKVATGFLFAAQMPDGSLKWMAGGKLAGYDNVTAGAATSISNDSLWLAMTSLTLSVILQFGPRQRRAQKRRVASGCLLKKIRSNKIRLVICWLWKRTKRRLRSLLCLRKFVSPCAIG